MTGPQIKAMSDVELVREVFATERELVAKRFALSMNKLENTSELRRMRSRIARLRTEIRAREIAAELPKDRLFQQHRVEGAPSSDGPSEQSAPARGGFLQGVVDKLKPQE